MLGLPKSAGGELSEKELSRAALWAALFVICSLALAYLVFWRLHGKTVYGYRRYYALLMAAVIAPIMPGAIVGGGIGELFTYFGGDHDAAVYWISTVAGAAFNWYFYFLLIAAFIRWRNKRNLARAT